MFNIRITLNIIFITIYLIFFFIDIYLHLNEETQLSYLLQRIKMSIGKVKINNQKKIMRRQTED